MLSSLSRLTKGRQSHRSDRSPFSSPHSGLLSSPVATRRGAQEERRRPAADFDRDASSAQRLKIDEEAESDGEENDDDDEDGDEDARVDEDEDASPLLPIFSAAHLGISKLQKKLSHKAESDS